MARTYRDIGWSVYRRPRHRHRLLAGESKWLVVTEWDDKPVAAVKEVFGAIQRVRHERLEFGR